MVSEAVVADEEHAERVAFPPWSQFLFEPMRYKVAYGGRGCLARGTKVIMADGSLKAIEDVVKGDKLLGPDSKPRKVLSLCRGTEPLYKVKQTSANDYIVNGAHVLVLKKSESCKKDKGEVFSSGNYRRPNGRYDSWDDEVEITVEDWLKQSKRWKDNFRGFRAGLLKFPKKQVQIDPYLLGLWLGDGLHRELMITSADEEIINWLDGFAKANNLVCTQSEKYGKSNKAVDVRLKRTLGSGKFNHIWEGFKHYNLVKNKHIPEDYIVNDEQTRLSVLAGLIDSDGTYVRGGYIITSAKETLAKQIKRLADTLGFRTSINHRKTTCQTGAIGDSWAIAINGSTDRIPCVLSRKKATVNPNKDKMLSMIDIEYYKDDEYFGVVLDGDKRFLLEDGTVTHNSSKSWTFARALLTLAGSRKIRILCAREFQNSITESVHRLLSEQIDEMGIGWFFTVQQQSIFGINGSEFIFSGIRNNPQKIKSTEGIDIVWVEEAETVSNASWDILIPTIRKAGSEIWVTFNPRDAADPTYKRFVLNIPPDCISKEVNWRDNPWFPDELRKEMEYMRSVDIDAYNHIWEGKCAIHSQAQVFYGKWAIEDFVPDTERWDGPYHGVDWGFSQDPTTMIKCWIGDGKLYIEKEAWGLHTELDKIVELFMTIEDSHKYTIRADNSRPETISYMQKHGYPKIEAARKWPGSVEDGIGRIRAFEKVIIHPRCKKTADEFRLYSYKVDRISGDIMPDILDKNNHMCDALRYALTPIIDNSVGIGKRHRVSKTGSNVYKFSAGRNGWMA